MKRIAVIGAGIAGMGAAHRLALAPGHRRVTLFEAGVSFGGHAHTVDVTLPDAAGRMVTHGVDTGFLVFNERTYPQLIALFASLGVPVAASDMSFSVQVPREAQDASGLRPGLQWCGSDLNSVFAQRRNLWSPPFWRMLADILRFNRITTALATSGNEAGLREPIGDFLRTHGFSEAFREGYLLPMVACIWSCPVQQMLQFPIATLIRFCHNHGLLQVANRPQWFTVRGGSREYVRKLIAQLPDARTDCPVQGLTVLGDEGKGGGAGVMVHSARGSEHFDEVVLATHSDQALQLLGKHARDDERATLGAIRYHANEAVLHTDTTQLPHNLRAWAAWNYERAARPEAEGRAVCLHYLINRLQPLPWSQPVVVSLNPLRAVQPEQVLARFQYAHPIFDQAAMDAQARLPALQGRRGIWFAGAWTGYGFHEDGLKSGLGVAASLLAKEGISMADDAAQLAGRYLHEARSA